MIHEPVALGSDTSGPAVLSMNLALTAANRSPSTPFSSVLTVSGPLTPDTLVVLARFAECDDLPQLGQRVAERDDELATPG